jgi:hypothetical protein
MPSRRDAITMTPAEIDGFLHGRRVMNVATIGPSGHPHVVAMWYGFVDGKPAFWTFGKSQKILNLRRDNKITALVEDGEKYSELRGVELVGTATIIEDYDTSWRSGSPRALHGPGHRRDTSVHRGPRRKRLGVVIDVERTVTWDHTKLAGAY